MLVPLESSSAVLVMIRNKSVYPSATVLTLDELIVVKLRFLRGYPSLMPSSEGNLRTQRHEICSQETRDSTPSYGKNPESLSYLGLNRYRVVTDGRRDGQYYDSYNTRFAVPAVVRKMPPWTSYRDRGSMNVRLTCA